GHFMDMVISGGDQQPPVLKKVITLDLETTTMIGALKAIAQKSGLKLSYDTQLPELNTKVTLGGIKGTVAEVLRKVLKNTGLSYRIMPDKYLIIVKKQLPKQLKRQAQTISGTVVDAESGATLPGVNVILKGTTTGTATNTEGGYSLDVSSLQDTLIFSFIGYQTQEIAINGRTTIDVELHPQTFQGEELVVVGYGTQKRENITGAVASIDYSEELQNRPITNASQALSGKM